MTMDLARADAVDLAAGFADGSISPVEATEAALAAIDTYDPVVNAMVLVDADGARAAAAASARRWRDGSPLGPFDGVPTTIKDILLTTGWPTLRGSALIDAAGPWTEDAPSVARLREAGCVLLGKTTTPEFAWKGVTDSPRHGATGNPWGAQLTAGGSSGGSATAVGLGMGAWSVGTDGGGSVRIPAAFTGTVTLKPTYGLVPHYPASPFGTLAHAGPMTRSVVDAAAMLDLLVGFDARDWSALPTPAGSFRDGLDGGVDGLRIAYSPTLGHVTNDREVDAAVRRAVEILADAGALVTEVDPGVDDPVAAFHTLWFAGTAKVLRHFSTTQREGLDPLLARSAEIGAALTASDYLDAVATRMSLGQTMGRFHQRYDILLTPTLPIAAFDIGRDTPPGSPSPWWTSWTPYTYPFNMTGQPAASVPCGLTADRRPIGLQIIGPRHHDARVLRVAHTYQLRTDWHEQLPTLAAAPTGEGRDS